MSDTTPLISSATVKAIIAAARIPTPVNTLSSTILTPSINGVTFSMNSDKHSPNFGNNCMTASEKPATKLPSIEPIPCASCSNTGIPASRNF